MVTILQPVAAPAETLPLWHFTTARYLQMIQVGVLGPKDHVELVGGMVVEMSPQGSRHNHFLMQLNRLFVPLWDRAIIAIQATATIAEGAVYDPDMLLLRHRPDGYKDKHPSPQDIMLVVEASESSLRRDQQVKLPVYASAGIAEYWIADLDHETLIVNREPEGNGYRAVQTLRGDDLISPVACPDFSFAVRKLFD
jgi:Uma2 family endonuclease